MDKTEKPTQKTPTFLGASSSSTEKPNQATDEFETDALFAGLFDETPAPQEHEDNTAVSLAESLTEATEKTKEQEEKTVASAPPKEETPAIETLAPTPKVKVETAPSAPLDTPYKVTPPPPSDINKEASLHDLVAVLEENITRLREERITPPQPEPPPSRKDIPSGLDLAPPSSTGGLLGLLEKNAPVSKASSPTPKPQETSHPPKLQERYEKLQERMASIPPREVDADWRLSRALQGFLEEAGHSPKPLPLSQGVLVLPSWFWLVGVLLTSLGLFFFGVWAQVALTFCLGMWFLEQGMGWSIAELWAPQKAGTLLYLPPQRTKEPTHEEQQDLIVAVPYRLASPEPPLPRKLMHYLPPQIQRFEIIYHPRVLGVVASVLWLVAVTAPLKQRVTQITLVVLSLLLCALLAGFVWEALRPSPKTQTAWTLAASLELYEHFKSAETPHALHLLWFDARDPFWATKHFLQQQIRPFASQDALWIGIWPYHPEDTGLALVEKETYLSTQGLHPHLKHLLADLGDAEQPQRYHLTTKLWDWPLRQKKRPFLLLGSDSSLSSLTTSKAPQKKQAPEEEEAVFQVSDGTAPKEDKMSPKPVSSGDTTNKLFSFCTSLFAKWQGQNSRGNWLPLVFLAYGLWHDPAQAASRCDKTYKSETRRCETNYTKAISRCKNKANQTSSCNQQEKQGASSCKALYDRVKGDCNLRPMSEEQNSTCAQLEQQAKTACGLPSQHQTECEQQAKSCLSACNKGEDACEKRCRDQQIQCLREKEDTWVRCQRQARQKGTDCKRKAQDQEMTRVYRCLQESVAARLRCQRSKRDERTRCEDKLADQERTCRRAQWDERRSCYETALQRRLRCR